MLASNSLFCVGGLLRQLVGHEYGGQAVVIVNNEIAYTASLDRQGDSRVKVIHLLQTIL